MSAKQLEDAYQRYRHLRKHALAVYAPKLEEYDESDYETVCLAILFEFDRHNQRAIAQRLGLSHTRFLEELVLLSTGARLQRQGK
jgi:hypothetical protein